jgi:hypothetical protein
MKMLLIIAALVAALSLGAHADTITAIGGAIISNELPKCVNGIGVPGGCIGPGDGSCEPVPFGAQTSAPACFMVSG